MGNIVTDIQEVENNDPDKHLPGQRLREMREKRGLLLADVAAQLLLTEEQIKALEENEFKHFPAPMFVSGYLRKYAGLLGIPADPLIQAFESSGMETPSLQAELTSNIPRPKRLNLELSAGILVAAGVIILLLVWLFSGDAETRQTAQTVQSTRAPQTSTFDATLDEEIQDTAPVSTPLEATIAAAENTLEEHVSVAPVAQVKKPAPVSNPVPVSEPAPASGPDRLLLHFSEDSWVEITDARGERLYFSMGKAGQSRMLEGQAPFDILLGNAPAVQIEYNGVSYNHKRFNRKNVARFKLGSEAG